MASYNGAVIGGMAQDVMGTTSLVVDEELPQDTWGTHSLVTYIVGVERTISGWAMYLSGGVILAGEEGACPPDSGQGNREVPQIVRAVP